MEKLLKSNTLFPFKCQYFHSDRLKLTEKRILNSSPSIRSLDLTVFSRIFIIATYLQPNVQKMWKEAEEERKLSA